MNKLKKLGLTALAGSLVATSVSAVDFGATGSWAWSWDSTKGGVGNPMSMTNDVLFSASGETDQGWTATVAIELDGGTQDDESLTLDFGDGGVFQYGGNSKGGRGVGLVSNLIPSADSAVYTLSATSGDEYGVARGAGGADNLSHQITVGDLKIGAEIQKGAGTSTSWGLQYSGIDSLTVGVGISDISPGAQDGGSDSKTIGGSYAVSGLTVGYQMTEVDLSASDEDAVHYGASFAVNDDMTISYGRQTVEMQGKANDEINSGFSASYTMGSMSFTGYVNKTENTAGASTASDEGKGITLAISF